MPRTVHNNMKCIGMELVYGHTKRHTSHQLGQNVHFNFLTEIYTTSVTGNMDHACCILVVHEHVFLGTFTMVLTLKCIANSIIMMMLNTILSAGSYSKMRITYTIYLCTLVLIAMCDTKSM